MPSASPTHAILRAGLSGVAVALLVASATASAQADPRQIAGEVLRGGDYSDRLPVGASEDPGSASFTFPGGATGGGGGAGAGDPALDGEERSERPEGGGEAARRPSGGEMALPLGGGGGSVLLWIGVAVLAAVFVFVLASLRPRGGDLAEAARVAGERADPEAPPGLRVVAGDPDALAGEGRYEEAIAALLLAALREVGWRPEGLMRSRTAREILASVGGTDPRRRSLAALVAIQERVAFAGVEADEGHWREAQAMLRAIRDASEAA